MNLNRILHGFSKAKKQLDEYIEWNDSKEAKHQEEIKSLNEKCSTLHADRGRAVRSRTKIMEILGD